MSKIGWVFGVLKQNNVDTNGMSPAEAFAELEKLREQERKDYAEVRNTLVYALKSAVLQKQISEAKTPNEQRQMVFDYIMENLRGKYPSSDGREVIISRKSADKFVQNATEIKLRVAPGLKKLIQAGRLKNIIDATHPKFVKFAYYNVSFEVGGKTYDGILNVGITKMNDAVLYDLNPFNEKSDY